MSDQSEPFVAERQTALREAASSIPMTVGGAQLENFAHAVDYAKYMSRATVAIPAHLRENVGACLAVIDMAGRWGMSCYQVARMTYVVNDVLSFQSQLIHAVIEKFAPLSGRLRCKYDGSGIERTCTVYGKIRGEDEPIEYTTPPVGKITPKNSPLWKSDEDQQLFYLACTRFCRRYFPDVLMGVYSPDEIEDAGLHNYGPDRAKDVTGTGQTLADRLKAQSGNGDHAAEGFRDGVVEAGLNGDLDHAHAGAAEGAGAPAETGGTDAKKPRQRGKGARAKAAAAPHGESVAETAGQTDLGGGTVEVFVKKDGVSFPVTSDPNAYEPTESELAQGRAALGDDPDKPQTPSGEAAANAREAAKMPVNQSQYAAWFYAWLPDMGSKEDITDRWNAERNLRNKCGVTAEDREPLEAAKAKRMADVPKRTPD